MKKLLAAIVILIMIFSVFSCGKSATVRDSGVSGEQGISPPRPTVTVATTTATAIAPSAPGTAPVTTPDLSARLIVRNGDIQIMVDDIKIAIDQITNLATQKKGFVVTSKVSPAGQGATGVITIRVPAEEFENTMRAIASLAVEVKSQSTSSRDVTQEYTDLNARLSNLQATEQQYLKILEKATTVQDILNVQKELSNTRAQIESLKGQIQYLQQTSATSLISVNLQQSKLIAKINVSRTVANVDEAISFSPDVSGGFTPFSYQWNFGDKTTSTESRPAHSYGSTGNFEVSFKVTDGHGSEVTDKTNIVISGGWNGGSVARAAWRALVMFGKVLLNVIIWLGIFSPVWIIGGGLAIYFTRRSKRKRQQPPPPAQPSN